MSATHWIMQICLRYGSSVIASAIVYIGLVSVFFAFLQVWPPVAVQLGASIGGALSPSFWKLLSSKRSSTRKTDNEDFMNF